MEQALHTYIVNAMAIADARNLAYENPIVLESKVGQEVFLIVVSITEPGHLLLPLNVTWIVADPESNNHGKAMRRTGKSPVNGYRNSWSLLETFADILAESQVYDLGNTFVLGELGKTDDTLPATADRRGLVLLNRAPLDSAKPSVIATEDYRMANARFPRPHAHAHLPASLLLGSSGYNASTVKINTSVAPVAGQTLMITDAEPGATVLEAEWQNISEDQVVYAGAAYTSLRIDGPISDTFNESTTIKLRADALFSDGGEILDVNPTWLVTSGGENVVLNTSTGELTSAEVTGNQMVDLRASWTHPASSVRRTADITLTISDTSIPVNLVSISIEGSPTIDEATQSSYTVRARFDDGSERGVTPATFTTSNPEAGTLSDTTGIFTATTALTQTEVTTLSATFTDKGVTRSSNYEVTVVDTTVYPSSAKILGPATLNEGQDVDYLLEVTFSDGTVRNVAVTDWALTREDIGAVNASTGQFVSRDDVTEDKTATLSASYTSEDTTVGDTLALTLTDITVYPVLAEILGVSTLDEAMTANFSMQVTFSDESVVIVSVSDWAASNASAGTIRDNTGQFTAVAEALSDQITYLSASYTGNDERTVSATHTLQVLDVTNYPMSAVIVGVTEMAENSSTSVAMNVTYKDNTVVQEDVTDWASSDTSVATIAATGNNASVQANSNLLDDTPTTISGSFTSEGRTVSDSHVITVNDTTNYPVSASIAGATTIDEGQSSTFNLYVTYADNTTSQVVASSWATSNIDVATANASTGEVTATENVPASVEVTVSATYTLDGRTVSDDKVINIVDTTVYPVSAKILGPVVVNENTSVTYTLEVRFDDASDQVMDVTDWASSNPAAGSIDASKGLFTAPANVSSDVTTNVSASFTRDGVTVNALVEVNITDDTVYPASARIIGPNTIDEGLSSGYSLEVTYTDESKSTVPVTNWASNDLNVASINANTGLARAVESVTQDESVELSASHTADGITVAAARTIVIKDTTEYPVSMVIVGPSSLIEGESSVYQVDVTYTTDRVARKNASTLVNSNEAAGSITDNTFTSIEVTSDQATTLTASYIEEGRTLEAVLSVLVTDATVYPQSAEVIGGGSINEGESGSYILRVIMGDGTSRNVTAADWTSDNTEALNIGSGTGAALAANNVVGNKTATVSGSFTENGITVTANKAINIVDTTIYPVSAEIIGDTIVGEGEEFTYTLSVQFSDESTSTVAVDDWAIDNSGGGTIGATTGLLKAASNLSSTVYASLSASYTVDGTTVTDSLAIQVRDTTIYPESAVITGVTSLEEGESTPLTFTVTSSDSSSYTVAAAGWTSSNPAVATVNAEDGVVTAQQVTVDSNVTISAEYTDEGVTVTDTHIIAVRDTTVYPVSANILGSESVNENTSTQYTLEVLYTDGSTSTQNADSWISDDVQASVSDSGMVTIEDVSADFIYNLTASFTRDGVTVNDTHEVSVTDTTNYPVSAAIKGPNSVPESESQTYTLEVTYTDSSTATVLVNDWASTNTAAGTIGASTGVFEAADVNATENTTLSASFREHGRTVSSTAIVEVTNTDGPESVSISGPNKAAAGDEPVNFQALVTNTDGSTNNRTNEGTWTLSDTNAGTIDAATGVFTPLAP